MEAAMKHQTLKEMTAIAVLAVTASISWLLAVVVAAA
jgi:hypothetical protein